MQVKTTKRVSSSSISLLSDIGYVNLIKGIHPGIILERELRKRGLSKRSFALSINEYPQLLGDITKGKRKINPSLSIRIGKALGLDDVA